MSSTALLDIHGLRQTFPRADGGELQDQGLYVGMAPWQSYFLALEE